MATQPKDKPETREFEEVVENPNQDTIYNYARVRLMGSCRPAVDLRRRNRTGIGHRRRGCYRPRAVDCVAACNFPRAALTA